MAASTVVGRVGEPEDIGAACLYRTGQAGSFITGAALPVDGGCLVGHKVNGWHRFRAALQRKKVLRLPLRLD